MTENRTSWGWAAKLALGVFTVAYPMVVYAAMVSGHLRWAGIVLVAYAFVFLLVRLSDGKRANLLAVLPAPLAVLAVVALSWWMGSPKLLLLLPTFINGALLVTFGVTLRAGATPMVERFARLVHDDLSPAQQGHCRAVTSVWCAFFAANGLVALSLALWAPLKVWTLYTGLVAYVLMGLLFAGEYVVRAYRFRRYGRGLLDRALSAIFPPRV